MYKNIVKLTLVALLICGEVVSGSDVQDGELLEQGRTFVHHAMKRMAILLPAVFFKLGVAFTLLVLVTIVAVNNGVIGFMLLVVGLSSVLARLQQAPTPTYTYAPTSPYHHYIDRRYDQDDSGKTQQQQQQQQQQAYTEAIYANHYY